MVTNFDFIFIFFYLLLALVISLILIILSYIIIFQNLESEKISAYECGFQPFEDSRQKFDIHFYLVAIFFILFDLEIVFLFPWALNIYSLNLISFISGIYFIVILSIGLIYEFFKKALELN